MMTEFLLLPCPSITYWCKLGFVNVVFVSPSYTILQGDTIPVTSSLYIHMNMCVHVTFVVFVMQKWHVVFSS